MKKIFFLSLIATAIFIGYFILRDSDVKLEPDKVSQIDVIFLPEFNSKSGVNYIEKDKSAITNVVESLTVRKKINGGYKGLSQYMLQVYEDTSNNKLIHAYYIYVDNHSEYIYLTYVTASKEYSWRVNAEDAQILKELINRAKVE